MTESRRTSPLQAPAEFVPSSYGLSKDNPVFLELHGDELRIAASSGLGYSCSLMRCTVAVPAPARYLVFEYARAPDALECTDMGGGVLGCIRL